MARYFMGIDPDMHEMPVVCVDESGAVAKIDIIRVLKKHTGRDALIEMAKSITDYQRPQLGCRWGLAVEGQELYQFGKGKTANPKSIMFLATVAGAALAHFQEHAELFFPTPQEWKGSVPKQIHQGRVLGRMKWEYARSGSQGDGYCYPTGPEQAKFGDYSKGQWKHIVDAIGLAQWCREQCLEIEARKARLS